MERPVPQQCMGALDRLLPRGGQDCAAAVAVDADGEGVQATLGAGDGGQSPGRDTGSTGGSERVEGGERQRGAHPAHPQLRVRPVGLRLRLFAAMKVR